MNFWLVNVLTDLRNKGIKRWPLFSKLALFSANLVRIEAIIIRNVCSRSLRFDLRKYCEKWCWKSSSNLLQINSKSIWQGGNKIPFFKQKTAQCFLGFIGFYFFFFWTICLVLNLKNNCSYFIHYIVQTLECTYILPSWPPLPLHTQFPIYFLYIIIFLPLAKMSKIRGSIMSRFSKFRLS